MQAVPPEGLQLAWETPVGLGYAGPVIVDRRVIVMDYQMESGNITNNAGLLDVDGVKY